LKITDASLLSPSWTGPNRPRSEAGHISEVESVYSEAEIQKLNELIGRLTEENF